MTLQDFAHIGTILAGLAGLIALVIAFFQLGGLRKSLGHSNLMAIFNIEFELNRRKEKVAEIQKDILEKINGKKDSELSDAEKEWIKTFEDYRNVAYENYLNAFDRLSYFIIKGSFQEEDFRLEFRDMLFETIENDPSKFGTTTPYRNMMFLYNRWKEI
jgi:hypothetical protein